MVKQAAILEYLLSYHSTSKIEFLWFLGHSIYLEMCETVTFSIWEYAESTGRLLKGKEGAKGYKRAIDPLSAPDEVLCY